MTQIFQQIPSDLEVPAGHESEGRGKANARYGVSPAFAEGSVVRH
jgi:hypothetical protein